VSLFDEIFISHEQRMRNDVRALQADMAAQPNVASIVRPLQDQVARLEMISKTLLELVVAKGVATQTEVTVLMQQIDLSDGREDGGLFKRVKTKAPKCKRCLRFINPSRTACIYCGEAISAEGDPYRDGAAAKTAPIRTADCGGCGRTVDESETYFTASGLRCEACYDPS